MNMMIQLRSRPEMPAVTSILSRYDRHQVEAFIEIAVAMLDALDGDPDDQDCADAEDDFAFTGLANVHRNERGPGCPISDPDHGVDDVGDAQCSEDEVSCAGNGLHRFEREVGCPISDPGGQCDEDDIGALGILPFETGAGCVISDPDVGQDDIGDSTDAEDDFWLSPQARHYAGSGPGCSISDDDRGDACL